ncbi:MAG: CBS domain-containing protein [Microscillaceae bacterium]|jgi:CBS domain-containing protein|nr:CBS domain-containing protein [Microscillaceae bacterium]
MIAEDLINPMIPPLKLTDKVQKAIQWMEELRVNQLPVIEHDEYRGLVTEDLIYQFNDEKARIGDLSLTSSEVFVQYNQHFYEILRLANLYSVEVIPVLGEENNFLGVVTLNDTLNALAETSAMQEPGGILILAIDKRDYSLTEISRLVEGNNAKILSTQIADDKHDYNKLHVTIKINTTDLNRIVATFERFNYNIIAKFQSVEPVDIDKERIDLLFKYLSI